MIESTPAETRQQYRDHGNVLPSDYELQQRYGNATIGAACYLWGDDVYGELEQNITGLLDTVRNKG